MVNTSKLPLYAILSCFISLGASHPHICFFNHLKTPASAYITGSRPDHGAAWVDQSGKFFDKPKPGPGIMVDVGQTHAIAHKIEPQREVCHPLPGYLYQARIWACENSTLEWHASDEGMSQPLTASNYALMEFSYSQRGIYINPSSVDIVSPAHLSYDVIDADGRMQSVLGLRQGALERTCSALKNDSAASGAPWDKLCVYNKHHDIMRIEAPYIHLRDDGPALDTYFAKEVDHVWARYTEDPLTIRLVREDIQCRVDRATQRLKCPGSDHEYEKPSAKDILTCNTGPFTQDGNHIHKGINSVLCAAFNRGTLMLPQGDKQPHGVLRKDFYPKGAACNRYAAEFHANAWNGSGAYATQYDDVNSADGKESCAQKYAANPKLIKVHIGPRPLGNDSSAAQPDKLDSDEANSAPLQSHSGSARDEKLVPDIAQTSAGLSKVQDTSSSAQYDASGFYSNPTTPHGGSDGGSDVTRKICD